MSDDKKIESTENEQNSNELELEVEVKRAKSLKTNVKGGIIFLSLGSCVNRG